MIVLDTNVLSEAMRPAPAAAVPAWMTRHKAEDLFTKAVTEAEILFGVAILPDGHRKQDLEAGARRVVGLFAGRVLAFDSSKGSRDNRPGQPEAGEVPEALNVPAPVRRAEELRKVGPGTAANNAVCTLSGCPGRAIARSAGVAFVVTILCPFPDIAVNLIEPPGIGLEAIDR
jgi:hypothetical protein